MTPPTTSSRRRRGRRLKEPTAEQAQLLDDLGRAVTDREGAEGAENEALAAAYLGRAPMRALAEVMGMTERAVRSRLRAAGIDSRANGSES